MDQGALVTSPVRQSAFVGGEVSPAIQARVDLQRFHTSLKRCSNMIVLRQGGVVNRAGLEWIAATKIQVVPDAAKTRLVRFAFSELDSFMLEFAPGSPGKIRFYQNGVVVLAGGGGIYEVTHPYAAADIARLDFDQLGDVITVVHPSYAPYELKRFSADNWTLTAAASTSPIAPPANLDFEFKFEASDATHQQREWSWVVTAEDANGNESYASAPLTLTTAVLYPDIHQFKLKCDPVVGAVRYNLYRGRDGMYGFICSSTTVNGSPSKVRFKDDATAPAYSDSPPVWSWPFGSNEYPSTVTYYQQRQVFGRTNNHRQRVIASNTGQFLRFDKHEPLQDSDAINIDIAADSMDELRHLVHVHDIIALTGSAVWRIGAGPNEPFTLRTIQPLLQDETGASWVGPAKMGGVLAFVDSAGRFVHDVHFDGNTERYSAGNISILAAHLFERWNVVKLAYARAPFSVLWALRSDGTLLGLTYDKDHEVWAWHQHDTPGGEIVDICVVPEAGHDCLYCVVKRGVEAPLIHKELPSAPGNYTIERMVNRQVEDCMSVPFLDCHVAQELGVINTYEQAQIRITDPGAATWLVGSTVWVRFGPTSDAYRYFTIDRGGALLLFPVTWVGKHIVVTVYDEDGNGYQAQLLVTGTHVQGGGLADDLICTVEGSTVPTQLRGVYTAHWKYGDVEATLLQHLDGQTCRAVLDGVVIDGLVPEGGAVDLPFVTARLHIGLPYVSEIQTLPINFADKPLTGTKRIVERLFLEVENSRELKMGESLDALTEWTIPVTPLSHLGLPELHTAEIEVPNRGRWSGSGSVYIRQEKPFPLSILSATPTVAFGG